MSLLITGKKNTENPILKVSRETFNRPKENFKVVGKEDKSNLSEVSNLLNQSGVRISNSSLSHADNIYSFDSSLKLRDGSDLEALFNYNILENSFNLRMTFLNSSEFRKDDQFGIRQFTINGNLSSKNTGLIKTNKTEEKEDILGFVKKLGAEIIKIAKDKNKNIKSIVLDADDMEEIASFQDEKGRKSLLELINLIILTARLKQAAEKNKNAKDVSLYAERDKIIKFNKEIIDFKKIELETTQEEPVPGGINDIPENKDE